MARFERLDIVRDASSIYLLKPRRTAMDDTEVNRQIDALRDTSNETFARRDICAERHKSIDRSIAEMDRKLNWIFWILGAVLAGTIINVLSPLTALG